MATGPLRESGSPPAVVSQASLAYVEAAFVQPAARWPLVTTRHIQQVHWKPIHCLTSALR